MCDRCVHLDRRAVRLAVAILGMAGWATGVLCAQSSILEGLDPLGAHRDGVHLYNASAVTAYYSESIPEGITYIPYLPNGTGLGADVAMGGSATIGWRGGGQRSQSAITYTPSYTGRVRYSEWNAFNHHLILRTSRRLSQKWSSSASVNGSISTADQFLFSPTVLGGMAEMPASFDDLAGAAFNGVFSNNQLASILTGAPIIESPARTLLYGNRMMSASLHLGLSYARSKRLSVFFGGTGSRSQHLENKTDSNVVSNSYLIPHTTSAGVNAGLSYSLTPRTQIGATFSSIRTFSKFEDAYTNSGTVSISRIMGRRWLVLIHGGAGFFHQVQHTYALPGGVQYSAGGSLAYKTYAHTFMAMCDRSMGDTFGIGAASTLTAGGAWSWHRPGRRWWVSSSFGEYRMESPSFQNIDAWRASARFGRMLTAQSAWIVQYAYMKYSSGFTGIGSALGQNGVLVAVTWNPNKRM